MDLGFALQPLVLLPGVALLVMSTSARMGQLHDEVLRVAESPFPEERKLAGQMVLRRGRYFRNSLRLLYVAVVLLCVAGFVGGLGVFSPSVQGPVLGLTCFAIISVILSAMLLIVESTRSLRALQSHVELVEKRHHHAPRDDPS
ncbi:MAG: hypothetical protein ACI9MC_000126 [Kiritimatiellia bacterium]|jgi:hypothetical protein